jgi:ribosomal protein S8
MSKIIHHRTTRYIEHKTNILIEQVYLSIQDKIFDAENYDEFEIDSDNNIYVTYSLKRDENIFSEAHDLIADQIKRKYRRKLEAKLEEKGYFVEYDDSDIHVYFEKPLKADNDDSSEISSIEHISEQNILKYKPVSKAKLITRSEDSGEFDFGEEDN